MEKKTESKASKSGDDIPSAKFVAKATEKPIELPELNYSTGKYSQFGKLTPLLGPRSSRGKSARSSSNKKVIESTSLSNYTSDVLKEQNTRDEFARALVYQGLESDAAYAISASIPASVLADRSVSAHWAQAIRFAVPVLRNVPSTLAETVSNSSEKLAWTPARLYGGKSKDGNAETFFLSVWEERFNEGDLTQSEVSLQDSKLYRALRHEYAGKLEKFNDLLPSGKRGRPLKGTPAADEAIRLVSDRRALERNRAAAKRTEP